MCDGEAAYADPNVAKLTAKIGAARVIFVGTPIYNFDANAAVKNLVELTVLQFDSHWLAEPGTL